MPALLPPPPLKPSITKIASVQHKTLVKHGVCESIALCTRTDWAREQNAKLCRADIRQFYGASCAPFGFLRIFD